MNVLDTLLRLMCIPSIVRQRATGVCRTSDGCYLLRQEGDVGYDVFLGKPRPVHDGPGLDNARSVWNGLTDEQKQLVRNVANNPDGPVVLAEFGIGEDE
jgi:hypothetical protein